MGCIPNTRYLWPSVEHIISMLVEANRFTKKKILVEEMRSPSPHTIYPNNLLKEIQKMHSNQKKYVTMNIAQT